MARRIRSSIRSSRRTKNYVWTESSADPTTIDVTGNSLVFPVVIGADFAETNTKDRCTLERCIAEIAVFSESVASSVSPPIGFTVFGAWALIGDDETAPAIAPADAETPPEDYWGFQIRHAGMFNYNSGETGTSALTTLPSVHFSWDLKVRRRLSTAQEVVLIIELGGISGQAAILVTGRARALIQTL